MDQNYLQILIDTITKKEETLRKLLEITIQQEELSKQELYPSDEIEKTLNEKEIQIARLDYLDEGFQSVYEHVRMEVLKNPEAYEAEVHKLQDKIRICTEIGNEIKVLEYRNHARFQELFAKTKKECSVSKTKASVAQSYFRTMNNTKVMDSCFVDKKK